MNKEFLIYKDAFDKINNIVFSSKCADAGAVSQSILMARAFNKIELIEKVLYDAKKNMKKDGR